MKKPISFIVALFLMLSVSVGCSNNTASKNQKADESIKAIEGTVSNMVIGYYKNLGRQIDVNQVILCKIKQYKEGYLALAWYTGEGSQATLFYIKKGKNNEYIISKKVDMEPALSLGFSVKRVADGNNIILCSNLNEETWVPPNDDKRFKADYAKIVVSLNNGTTIEEDVKGDKGYIIALSGNPDVVDIRLYNSRGKIINSLSDLSKYGITVVDKTFEQDISD